jgi:hypothetical protein
MTNKVFLNPDDIIEIEVVGDQTLDSVERMGRQASGLLSELRSLGKPCRVLDNLLQMGKVDAPARRLVVELSRQLDYDKLAMLGKGGGIMRFGTNLMLRASGRSYKIRYYDDRIQALSWLREKSE